LRASTAAGAGRRTHTHRNPTAYSRGRSARRHPACHTVSAMRISETITYAAGPEAVYAMVTDPDFQVRKCIDAGATQHDATVSAAGDGTPRGPRGPPAAPRAPGVRKFDHGLAPRRPRDLRGGRPPGRRHPVGHP